MKGSVFLDTNIFIYALTKPKVETDIYKRQVAIELLKKLYQNKDIQLSVQVVNEIHINMVRKFKIEDDIVFRLMQDNIFSIASVATLSLQTYNIAFDVRGKYNISYWDSLVVASALESKCDILYSEDMQDGLILEDKLKIVNPF